MTWKDILKEEDERERFRKPDGSTFVDRFGFVQKPYRRDKQPIIRDEEGNITEEVAEFREQNPDSPLPDSIKNKKIGLINWFDTIMQQFDEFLGEVGRFSVQSGGNFGGAGFQMPKREEAKSSKNIRKYGMEITTLNIESMLEGYLETLTGDTGSGAPPASFVDSERSIQGIMGSSGYNRIVDAALKTTEKMFSGIFDTAYIQTRKSYDELTYEDEDEDELPDIDFTKDPPDDWSSENWPPMINPIGETIKRIINDIDEDLDDVLNDAEKNIFDLDGDGDVDVSNNEIKQSIKAKMKKVHDTSKMKDLVKNFSVNVLFAYHVRYAAGQRQMESREDVADQTTEEEAEEMRNRPQVDMQDMTEEERRRFFDFEGEMKSIDNYTGEFSWRDILSKGSGVGMTTNAGFRPSQANVMYGKKKPCGKSKKSCGCGCGK